MFPPPTKKDPVILEVVFETPETPPAKLIAFTTWMGVVEKFAMVLVLIFLLVVSTMARIAFTCDCSVAIFPEPVADVATLLTVGIFNR